MIDFGEVNKLRTGERIGNAAKQKKINLHKLADSAGIPYNTLYSIVRRNSDKIDLETVKKLSIALDVSPIEILGDDILNWIEYGMDIYKRAAYSEDFVDLDTKHELDNAIRKAYNIKDSYLVLEVSKEEGVQIKIDAITDLLSAVSKLNDKGMNEAVKRTEELTHIPKYQQKEKPPEGQETPSDGK